jgi:2-oxoglutarate dehydrogenase E1 component
MFARTPVWAGRFFSEEARPTNRRAGIRRFVMSHANPEVGERGDAAGTDIPGSERERAFLVFRQWGYLQAKLDPLGRLRRQPVPELEITSEAAKLAHSYYCGPIGVEFTHIPQAERRCWIQERMERTPPQQDRHRILDRLLRAELFEKTLHARYPGTKRFSLEGGTALIPLLDEILEGGSECGAEELVLGTSHRGRLNLMVHIVGKSPTDIFAGFEDVNPRSVLGGGDVKYHMGASGEYTTRDGRTMRVQLVSNPSHLEAVDPVTVGRARARQMRAGAHGSSRILPLLIHGDGAFAGQGILAETMNYADLKGFTVGGTVHVIVNNMIGFTTSHEELHSSLFASSAAKRQPVPVFHVNGEDLAAVTRAGRMAVEYRHAFASDVVVDLIGYRRHGHSEVDDPTITQPRLYRAIKDHPPLWRILAESIGADTTKQEIEVRAEFEAAQKRAVILRERPLLSQASSYWDNYEGGCYKRKYEVKTGVLKEELREVAHHLTIYPKEFNIHPKVKKVLEQRAEMVTGKRLVDFGMAEALAFGTLLKRGTPVRMSGQDSRRGTFNQRHAVLIDTESEEEFIPLCHVGEEQARFEIYNSTLSEAGVLGFEYGYSRDYPETLVLWEAQFGDFVNNAQAIVDQFVSADEDKWSRLSGVVVLLPHGYEGQGPEHSSARVERFLQLAAEHNCQICQPSTAAQYFHLLRRQAVRVWRKPLIIFMPKSMLRHPSASSAIEKFSGSCFLPVRPEQEIQHARRVLVCTGKIGHELQMERTKRHDNATAILFLEQLYPFPEAELARELARHTSKREIIWVQEEPANMGALVYVLPRLKRIARDCPVRSVKRSASASPATGSARAHELEQKTLLALAFTTAKDPSPKVKIRK